MSALAASGAPEKSELRVGFMPLTDCAPIIVAAAKGFDRRHGLRIVPVRESSWAAVRDRLLRGENDASQLLYGMAYGVQTGVGGAARELAITMGLSRNGQGITLSRALLARGVRDGASLAALVHREPGCTFAHTFPTGNHAMWLYYWLAALGVQPLREVRMTTVPPPQMVAQMRAGIMDGYCVGEPWNAHAVREGVGFTVATSQHIWPDHPGKALGMTAAFVDAHPRSARALTAALLEAARWCDARGNRAELARLLAAPACIDCEVAAIADRLDGDYDDGIGRRWHDAHPLRFFDDGAVTQPWLSDGLWFLTQLRRWGLLRSEPEYLDIAARVQRLDVYHDACAAVGIAAPRAVMRRSVLFDGGVWDGSDPAAYAASFAIRA
ncbi:CmpA/NrtA family ABC transporter substrate-binding protein [Solimonas soli]|uniref:CmpA/NrtA family ABC transporter substrate-binding protein n=1 Tax=Solimonas soli TaxID=413479 RepID=UPI0004B79AF3|nr:CmpA/NrtA family ABC transporter substrate-binding protein [Solimonas soli]